MDDNDVYKTTDKLNRFDEHGREILNPTPMQPPLGYRAQPSLAEQIRQHIRSMKHLEDDEPETEEEADDFDIEDDPIIESRWENDMVPSIKEVRARGKLLEQEARKYAQPPANKQPEPKPAEEEPEPEPLQSREPPAKNQRSSLKRSFWPEQE